MRNQAMLWVFTGNVWRFLVSLRAWLYLVYYCLGLEVESKFKTKPRNLDVNKPKNLQSCSAQKSRKRV